MDRTTQTDYLIHDVLQTRWSPRAYDPRPIEPEKLLSMFEAARWAPSSSNQQPWRFLIAQQTNRAAYDKMLSVINDGNRRWAANAPVLMLTVAKILGKYGENRNAIHDVGQAVAYMTFQATALGLAMRQMGGISPEHAHDIYNIPTGEYRVLNGIALGYVAPLESLPEDLQHKEQAPRTRQPLTEFVFGEWEQTASLVEPKTAGG